MALLLLLTIYLLLHNLVRASHSKFICNNSSSRTSHLMVNVKAKVVTSSNITINGELSFVNQTDTDIHTGVWVYWERERLTRVRSLVRTWLTLVGRIFFIGTDGWMDGQQHGRSTVNQINAVSYILSPIT